MPTCFVVMGFGEKPDFATGRTLDLDKTYRTIIRPAVQAAGLDCIRADDVVHAGLIDTPMYELLLTADVVVADLSTSNANAIYELGVRHALRPHTTIVLAESEFKFPFDLGHLVIRKYEHLGRGIDAEVAEATKTELANAIRQLIATPKVDSPVFSFLTGLQPPGRDTSPTPRMPADAESVTSADDGKGSLLMEMFREARAAEKWLYAKELLNNLRERSPKDPYLIQQLALATYKSQQPSPLESLAQAKEFLEPLKPHETTDAETLGLWGAIHKRLWELTEERDALNEGIWALEKGFYVKNDHYNGINLAFMLTSRAAVSSGRDAVTDETLAERIRRRVIAICESQRATPLRDDEGNIDREQMFWVNASLVEALLGTGEDAAAARLKQEVIGTAPEAWMPKTLEDQLEKLTRLRAVAIRSTS